MSICIQLWSNYSGMDLTFWYIYVKRKVWKWNILICKNYFIEIFSYENILMRRKFRYGKNLITKKFWYSLLIPIFDIHTKKYECKYNTTYGEYWYDYEKCSWYSWGKDLFDRPIHWWCASSCIEKTYQNIGECNIVSKNFLQKN